VQEAKAEKSEVDAAVAQLKQLKIQLDEVVKVAMEENQKESKARCALEPPSSAHAHAPPQGGVPCQACHAA
jgi:hypothetical protein